MQTSQNRPFSRPLVIGAAIAIVIPAFSSAQDRGSAQRGNAEAASQPTVYTQLIACQSITDASQRLTCYDSATRALNAAETNRDIVIVDRAAVRETRRGLFGLRLPRIGLFGSDDENDADQVREIQGTVASAARGPGGVSFTFADGARWQQVDDRTVMIPRSGTVITIRRSGIGTYFANVPNGTNFKVERQR